MAPSYTVVLLVAVTWEEIREECRVLCIRLSESYLLRKLAWGSQEHTALKCGSWNSGWGLINSQVWLILPDELTPYLCSAELFKLVGRHHQHSQKRAGSKPLCPVRTEHSVLPFNLSLLLGVLFSHVHIFKSHLLQMWSNATFSIKLFLIHFNMDITSLLENTRAHSLTSLRIWACSNLHYGYV